MFASSRRTNQSWRFTCCLFMSFLLLVLVVVTPIAKASKRAPEASSTLLRMHKFYMRYPPHDPSLYHDLQVPPNATLAQITKSYRKLSRLYHPDKNMNNNHESTKQQLERVQQAFQILKDDTTRLPYHKYGLTNPNLAIILLSGSSPNPQSVSNDLDPNLIELLTYLGYDATSMPTATTTTTTTTTTTPITNEQQRKHRIRLIAARLVEKIRPFVEQTVDPNILSHYIAQDCNRLKHLPLGAQILRCVGRAYRHAGQKYLKTHHEKKLELSLHEVKSQWEAAKNFWTAALASGRVVIKEQLLNKQQEQLQQRKFERAYKERLKQLEQRYYPTTQPLQHQQQQQQQQQQQHHHHYYDGDDYNLLDTTTATTAATTTTFLGCDSDDNDFPSFDEFISHSEEDIRHAEQLKAETAVLQSLQVDAYWKVMKIDFDAIVKEACDMILRGDYFFFPSHQTPYYNEINNDYNNNHPTLDGWVSSSTASRRNHENNNVVVDANQAKLSAAEAMVMIGEIMIRCSKEGTSWVE